MTIFLCILRISHSEQRKMDRKHFGISIELMKNRANKETAQLLDDDITKLQNKDL